MTLNWNPFRRVEHNGFRAPRVVFHAAHVFVGVVAWVVAWALSRPWPDVTPAVAVALALFGSYWLKRTWIDWHRTSGRRWHLWLPWGHHDVLDVVSDAGLSLLGALHPSTWYIVAAYYILSLINGT